MKTQAQEYSHDGRSACMTPHSSGASGYTERVKTCRSIKLRDCNTSVRRGYCVGNNSEYGFGHRRSLFMFEELHYELSLKSLTFYGWICLFQQKEGLHAEAVDCMTSFEELTY
ncbi:hypothetical protein PV325_009176 [Microctonus aethiopoides]|nr:hypothetical protein PV325_009176 [Microctonus aethiopoides]KAK0078303.1 hypothetical protein PV326_009459 [Microctonus aethiopoides]